jgi:hypothetical protein
VVIWYIFPRFGILYQEKSGNPDLELGGLDDDVGGRVVDRLLVGCRAHRDRLASGSVFAAGTADRALEVGPGTDVMIFKLFSPKNSAKKLAFLTQNKGKILIITLVFEENANYFSKLAKIAENYDYNIDPWAQKIDK